MSVYPTNLVDRMMQQLSEKSREKTKTWPNVWQRSWRPGAKLYWILAMVPPACRRMIDSCSSEEGQLEESSTRSCSRCINELLYQARWRRSIIEIGFTRVSAVYLLTLHVKDYSFASCIESTSKQKVQSKSSPRNS